MTRGAATAFAGRLRDPGSIASLVASVLLLGPALIPGAKLHRDLVMVPAPVFNDRLLGVGSETPRAVPSDAVLTVLAHLVPGGLLAPLLLMSIVLAAGLGAGKLAGTHPVARSAASVAAIWNPYVVERLSIGQWALLLGYAALPWVIAGMMMRLRSGGPCRGLVLAVAIGGLGGASAALLVGLGLLGPLLARLVLPAGEPRATTVRRALRPFTVLGLGATVWVVPSLLRASLPTDPAGFSVFAAGPDLPWGTWLSVLTGGGIWSADVVPAGRDTLVGAFGAGCILLVGAWGLFIGRQRPAVGGLFAAGLLGLVVVAGTRPAAGLLVDMTGGALLRDASRQNAPWVVALAVGIGWAAQRLWRQAAAAGWLLVALPVAALPLAVGVSGALRPTTFPPEVSQIAAYLNEAAEPGAVAVLPYASYRTYSWNARRPSQTPWARVVARPVVASDDLIVSTTTGPRTVRGEDRLASAVGMALTADDSAAALRRLGVRWVIVDAPQGQAPPGAVRVSGGVTASLYLLPGSVGPAPALSEAARWVVVGADLLAGLGVVVIALTARRPAIRQNAH